MPPSAASAFAFDRHARLREHVLRLFERFVEAAALGEHIGEAQADFAALRVWRLRERVAQIAFGLVELALCGTRAAAFKQRRAA